MAKAQKRRGMAARAQATRQRRYRALLAHVASRVAELRDERGLTQEEASHRAEVDLRTWQRIEAVEVVQPTLLTLCKVAEALGVDVAELLAR